MVNFALKAPQLFRIYIKLSYYDKFLGSVGQQSMTCSNHVTSASRRTLTWTAAIGSRDDLNDLLEFIWFEGKKKVYKWDEKNYEE